MTKKRIAIGPGVDVDLDRLIGTRLLVQANSGGGKSWALRRLLEQTHGHVQQIVIDPEGEFSSLREKFDYILAARQGGDTLADPRTAKLLAERLLELGVSAICDIYELQPRDRVAFVTRFLEALVDAPKQLWHPVLVVVDEAHVFAPEQGHGEAESDEAVKGLATRGRKRGFCLVAATQRLSKLHKDVAAECNNKLIGRTALDVDMKRAGAELGFVKGDLLQLRDLEDGEFFAFGPALTKTVTRVVVGPVTTTHPKAGSKLAAVVPPPTAKVKAVLSKLADLPAEAEAREKTVKDLKTEIATLKRDLTAAKKAQPPAPKTEHVDKPVLTDADRGLLEKVSTALSERAAAAGDTISVADRRLDDAVQKAAAEYLNTVRKVGMDAALNVEQTLERAGFQKVLEKLQSAIPNPIPPPATTTRDPRSPLPRRVAPGLAPATSTRPARQVSDGLSGVGQRILNALAELELLKAREPERVQVAFLAGYTNLTSKGFVNALSELSSTGLVRYPRSGTVTLTDDGRAAAQWPETPRSSAEIQQRVLELLGGKSREILAPIIAAYPDATEREAVAAAAGYTNLTSKGFVNALSRLSSLGFVVYPSPRKVAAAPVLFLE